jgi:hypothetical protein
LKASCKLQANTAKGKKKSSKLQAKSKIKVPGIRLLAKTGHLYILYGLFHFFEHWF